MIKFLCVISSSFVPGAVVKTTWVIEEGKEVYLIVFDEEKCFDKGQEEVQEIFEEIMARC